MPVLSSSQILIMTIHLGSFTWNISILHLVRCNWVLLNRCLNKIETWCNWIRLCQHWASVTSEPRPLKQLSSTRFVCTGVGYVWEHGSKNCNTRSVIVTGLSNTLPKANCFNPSCFLLSWSMNAALLSLQVRPMSIDIADLAGVKLSCISHLYCFASL